MEARANWFQKNALVLYFVLAYAISWSVGVPLALSAQGKLGFALPMYYHYLYAYGPLLAALIVSCLAGGKAEVMALVRRLAGFRMGWKWWLISFSPLLGYGLIVAVQRVISGSWGDQSLLGEVNFLPNIGGWALGLWLITFGLGEEMGWRGFALPRLQQKMSALKATLLLGVLWGAWHLPIFFYLFQPSIAIGWFLGLLSGAILFTWMYNSSGGNLLSVVVWHATFNYITASKAGEGLAAAVLSTMVMVWAVVLIFVYKPKDLSRLPKQTK